MVVEVFCDDESGYLAWLGANQGGYVVNTYRAPLASYLKLHRASCRTISGTPAQGSASRTKDYIKVCATVVGELAGWAKLTLVETWILAARVTLKPRFRPDMILFAWGLRTLDSIEVGGGGGGGGGPWLLFTHSPAAARVRIRSAPSCMRSTVSISQTLDSRPVAHGPEIVGYNSEHGDRGGELLVELIRRMATTPRNL